MTTERFRGVAGGREAGFTMMELLTVMAIMFIMMSMAMAAYFGIVRTTAIRGAVDNLQSTLSLARQHAMTHRMRTYVMFWQNGTNARYVVCAQMGIHSGVSGSADLVVGASRWEAGELDGGTVYNLSDGSYAKISGNAANAIFGSLQGGVLNKWNYAHRYGWAIHDSEYLPTTLQFTDGSGPNGAPETIVFKPDGTTEKSGNGDYEIKLKEITGPATAELKVVGLTGLVEGV